jgi:pimeloyl-ACP methyl ester carboxylesterase
MRVFLIHGMGRAPTSMWVLKCRLVREGHRATLFGYLVTVSDLERIADRFVDRVRRVMREEAAGGDGREPAYAVVGHSLGNVITRLASPRLPPGFRRFAMLAPPNRSPVIARTLRDNLFFRATTRDTGRKLTDEEFFARLPVPDVPSLIIAGNRGPRSRRLPFGGAPNDGILKVEETRLAGIPRIEVPAIHTFLMNRRDVFEAIRDFLADPGVRSPREPSAAPTC